MSNARPSRRLAHRRTQPVEPQPQPDRLTARDRITVYFSLAGFVLASLSYLTTLLLR